MSDNLIHQLDELYRHLVFNWPDLPLEWDVLFRLDGGIHWYIDRNIQTAAVAFFEDGSYQLLVNPDFVLSYCSLEDSRIHFLVIHELLHIILAHGAFPRQKNIPLSYYNVAFDSWINACLSSLFSEEKDNLPCSIYDTAAFPEMLLRPPLNWPKEPNYPEDRFGSVPVGTNELMKKLYPRKDSENALTVPNVTIQEIIDLMISASEGQDKSDKNGENTSNNGSSGDNSQQAKENIASEESGESQSGTSNGPEESLESAIEDIVYLGDHDGLYDESKNRSFSLANQNNQDGVGKGSGLQGIRYQVQKSNIQISHILNRTIDYASKVQQEFSEAKLNGFSIKVLPSQSDRFAHTRARVYGNTNLLWKHPSPFSKLVPIPIYIDVSGSFKNFISVILPILYTLLVRRFKRKITTHQFSTTIEDLSKDELQKAEVSTTGGTDLNVLLEHILSQKIVSAVVITDGEFKQATEKHIRAIQRRGIKIFLIIPKSVFKKAKYIDFASHVITLPL